MSRVFLIIPFAVFWTLKSKSSSPFPIPNPGPAVKCNYPRQFYKANGDIIMSLKNGKSVRVVATGQNFVSCNLGREEYIQVQDEKGREYQLIFPLEKHPKVKLETVTVKPNASIQRIKQGGEQSIVMPEDSSFREFFFEESYSKIDTRNPEAPGKLFYKIRGKYAEGAECVPRECEIQATSATVERYADATNVPLPPIDNISKPTVSTGYMFRTYGGSGYSELDSYFNTFRHGCQDEDFEKYRTELKTYFHHASITFGLPYTVVACLSFQESEGFDVSAKSSTGASGIMQVTYVGFKRFHKEMKNEPYLKDFIDKYEKYAAKVGLEPKYISSKLFNPPRKNVGEADRLASAITADPKAAIGQGTALLADKLQILINAVLKNKIEAEFKQNRNVEKKNEDLKVLNMPLGKKLAMFSDKEKVQLYTAAVTAYNTGEGPVLAVIAKSKSMDDWTQNLIDGKISFEGKKHAIGIQRCMLNENARKNSSVDRIRESAAPRRGPMRWKCQDPDNPKQTIWIGDGTACNDRQCQCTASSKAKGMCLETTGVEEDVCGACPESKRKPVTRPAENVPTYKPQQNQGGRR